MTQSLIIRFGASRGTAFFCKRRADYRIREFASFYGDYPIEFLGRRHSNCLCRRTR